MSAPAVFPRKAHTLPRWSGCWPCCATGFRRPTDNHAELSFYPLPYKPDAMTDRTKLLLLQLALVLGVCGFFFFFGLGAFGLVGADEPRYAQIAREMFARHDWIVPTLNGAPWLEKPVLLYWKD